MMFLASGADAHASSSDPTPKAPSATSAGGDHNLSDQISLRNGRDPNATDSEMAEIQMPLMPLKWHHCHLREIYPETPTNSENLSPGENMEMEADSGDALVASLASLPNKTYQLVVDVNRQFQVHQSSQETSMNETQVETPMVSVGSRGLSVHEYQMKLAVNSQV